jgi:hypothetical protein
MQETKKKKETKKITIEASRKKEEKIRAKRAVWKDGPICKAQTDLCHICKGKLFFFFSRRRIEMEKERVQKSGEYQTTQIKREKSREKNGTRSHTDPFPPVSSRSRRKIDAAGIQIRMLEIVYKRIHT